MNETEFNKLKRDVAELMEWKKARIAQQITYPLDAQSQTILNNYFMSIVDTVSYEAGAGGNEFTFYIGKQGGITFELNPVSLVQYYVDPSTDIFTTSSNLKFFNDQAVTLITTDTAPSPLSAGLGTIYYVINSDGHIFQLSATLGGAAINVTTTGTGSQFITYS